MDDSHKTRETIQLFSLEGKIALVTGGAGIYGMHIVRALADKQLDFAALRAAVNKVSDPRHPWSAEWFDMQLGLLERCGRIIGRGDLYSVPEINRGH